MITVEQALEALKVAIADAIVTMNKEDIYDTVEMVQMGLADYCNTLVD